MSDVLIGQSYFLRFDLKLWRAMRPYPPLGAMYAASYLRGRGYQVALFDAMLAESEHEWASAIEHQRPRFAVLYEDNFNYLSKMCLLRMREAAFAMIALAKERGCTVIVAGSDVTDHAEDYLTHRADIAIVGEGEESLAEVLDVLSGKSQRALDDVAGLVYANSTESGYVKTAARPAMRHLDSLPFPAWDLIDVERYRDIWQRKHGYFSMNMVTTRGCPYHCNWCAKPIWGQRYNARSAENVVAELRWMVDAYRPDHIWYMDDILGLKPGWLKRYADLVTQHGLRVPFTCLQRADLLVRPGAVDALRVAGAHTVWIGAESGSQTVLDAMEKGTRVEQIYEAAARLRQADIETGFFLQFGYPGESRTDIEKTLRMVRECQPDDIGISVSYPLPGTKFHDVIRARLGEKQNWTDSSDLALLYRGPFGTEFYRRLHTAVHREFRMRKGWRQLHRVASTPRAWRPHHLRLLASVAYNTAALPLARRRVDGSARPQPKPATTISRANLPRIT